MPEVKPQPPALRYAGLTMLIVGEVAAWALGNLISTGYWTPQFLPSTMVGAPYDKSIAVVVTPFLLLAFGGLALM